MTLNEFFDWLMTKPIETMIVELRYKYSWEEKWTYSNEILEVDWSNGNDCPYIWLNDWNEGETDVEVLGCVPLSDVIVAPFKPILDAESAAEYEIPDHKDIPEYEFKEVK